MHSSLFGFVALNKPVGMTSHDCVLKIRKIFNIKRVGHGGTLDPLVTGVLPIALGKATRLLPYLKPSKSYIGTIQLGKKTNTDDLEGKIIEEQPIPTLEEKKINKILDSFRGEIKQRPPIFSSVHINGERAYKKARRGESFEICEKEVKIYKLNLLNLEKDTGKISLYISCSSGTYIRSLARDIGKSIGCGGCLSSLKRVEALGFKDNQSIKLSSLEKQEFNKESIIIDPLIAMNHLYKLPLIEEEDNRLWQTGRKISISQDQCIKPTSPCQDEVNQPIKFSLIINDKDKIIGVGEWESDSIIKPKIVFNAIG